MELIMYLKHTLFLSVRGMNFIFDLKYRIELEKYF
jgi:hypothetical protein